MAEGLILCWIWGGQGFNYGVIWGIMEKKMETIGITGVIWGLYWDNGKENGNYYNGL